MMTRFDWDAGTHDKCQKHGVSIVGIEAASAVTPRIAPAIDPAAAEQRFIAIGHRAGNRPLFIVFTLRRSGDHQTIRPISAR
jgi:uncharacterized DUF497 family protein